MAGRVGICPAGGTEQVVRVVDHLVKLAREERLR